MGRKKQRRKNVGWFSPARRKFLAEVLRYGAPLTTIVVNLQTIVGGLPTAPVAPVRKFASDALSIKLAPSPAMAEGGTINPFIVAGQSAANGTFER